MKRLISILLCAALLACLLPATASAAVRTITVNNATDWNKLFFGTGIDDKFNSGDTIELNADITHNSGVYFTDKVLTLDLNGHTLTCNISLTGSASIIVKDSRTGGKLIGYDSNPLNNNSTGSITVTDGEIYSGTNAAILNQKTGTIVVTGGKVWSGSNCAIQNDSSGKITISGTAEVTSSYSGGTIKLTDDTPQKLLEITGGSVTNTGSGPEVCFTSSEVTATNYSNYMTFTGGTIGNISPTLDLTFPDNAAYNIPAGTVGTTYNSDLSLFAYGGKTPYTYSIESAVTGLSISGGKLVYIRPNINTSATTATVKVTDSASSANTAEITIDIGAVTGNSPVSLTDVTLSTDAPVVGTPITATVSPAGASVSYKWQSSSDGTNWSDISGATGASYTPVNADFGKTIKVIVTGTGSYSGTAEEATTSAVRLKAEFSSQNSFASGGAPNNLKLTIGSGITSELGASNFGYLTIDESVVTAGDSTFTVSDGSLVINFVKSYLDSLSVGTHYITVNVTGTYADNYTATLTVKAPSSAVITDGRANPSTGISAETAVSLIFATALFTLGSAVIRKKK